MNGRLQEWVEMGTIFCSHGTLYSIFRKLDPFVSMHCMSVNV